MFPPANRPAALGSPARLQRVQLASNVTATVLPLVPVITSIFKHKNHLFKLKKFRGFRPKEKNAFLDALIF